MSPKSDVQTSKLDTYKLASSAVMVLIALAAFYYFSDYLLLIRVIGLLGVAGAAVAIALTTEPGARVLNFIKDSRAELRKVVWPTRTETLQTSLAVIAMVVVMGIFLWLLDMLLLWIVRLLTG